MKLIIVTCASTVTKPANVAKLTGAVNFNPSGLWHPTIIVTNFAAQVAGAKKNDREFVAYCTDGAILNVAGEFIDMGLIDASDVEIHLYRSETEKTVHGYSKDGYLNEDWPYGVLLWNSEEAVDQFKSIVNN